MKMKKMVLMLSIAAPMLVNASSIFGNIDLAKQAHKLAVHIDSLSKVEEVELCKDKTSLAAYYTERSAEQLMMKDYSMAKYYLKHAIDSLIYTTVESCTQASNILMAENQLTKLNDSIA